VLRLTDTQTKTVREGGARDPRAAADLRVRADRLPRRPRRQPALVHARRPIRRAAELRGLRVQLVQNITDVGHLVDDSAVDSTGEDKLLTQARLEDKSPFVIARFYEEAFHRDMALLNNRPADAYPRASEWIDAMLELIGRLVERGHAYVGDDGTVYFDARSYDAYGALSGNRLEDLRAGHRLEAADVGKGKRFHADWALWKRAGAGREMTWDSPWGVGFPGWHIECSAMSLQLLGEVIDVHTGGIDLRFPHHEDERRQSNCAVGRAPRSCATGCTASTCCSRAARWPSRPATSCSSPTSWRAGTTRSRCAWRSCPRATASRPTCRGTRSPARPAPSTAGARPSPPGPSRRRRDRAGLGDEVLEAVEDDLDTPRALQVLRRLEKAADVPDGAKFETFAWADRLLGLDLARLVGQAVPVAALPDGAQELLDARAAARRAKDFAASDRLRDELAALGVAVKDTPGGQEWSPV
jgi:cysteinyl-tRNA synthetase